MARINIEAKWFIDPRRELISCVIGQFMTDGIALFIWRNGQEYPDGKVPKIKLDMVPHLDLFIKADLVRSDGDFYYVRGSEKAFNWIKENRERAKKGGLASAATRLHSRSKKQAESKRALDSKMDLSAPSSVSSGSSVSSDSSRSSIKSTHDFSNRVPGNFFIPEYIKTWEAKYGSRPILSGKDLGIAKRISNSLAGCTESEICQLVATYFTADEQWFKTKAHDIATFEQNVSKLRALANKPEPEWIRKAKQEEQERKLRNGNA